MSSPANLSAQFPYTRKQLTPHDPSDVNFYASPRFVNHIDDHAISALSAFYENALPQGRILDICSSWVSHISPKHLGSQRIIGVGMNAKELEANPVLNGWAVHDLNREPYFFQSLWGKLQPGKRDRLIDENKFDAVICNVSIDYLSSPLEVTEGMADALQPGGWAYMVISNRCFPTKVVRPWLQISTTERLELVASYFHHAGGLYAAESYEGKRRPGEFFSEIQYRALVPEDGGTDPLWVVQAKRT